MIEYFKELFSKPKYLWTVGQEWAFAGLIVCCFTVLVIAILLVGAFLATICDAKYNKCENCNLEDYDCRKRNCLFCSDYKKKRRQKK